MCEKNLHSQTEERKLKKKRTFGKQPEENITLCRGAQQFGPLISFRNNKGQGPMGQYL
jgi:hypothetical protein